MKRLLIVAALCAAGCSNSPTSPSSVVPVTPVIAIAPGAPGVDRLTLHWDIVAPGCSVPSTPSPLPDPKAATRTTLADGSISASWPYRSRGTTLLLYARFVEGNGTMNVCSWDTGDV